MKNSRALAFLTACTLLTGSVSIPVYTGAEEAAAIETEKPSSPEDIPMNDPYKITYQIDWDKAQNEAEAQRNSYMYKLYKSGLSEEEVEKQSNEYYSSVFKELMRKQYREKAPKVLEELGIEPSKAWCSEETSAIVCDLTPEQLEKAKKSELVRFVNPYRSIVTTQAVSTTTAATVTTTVSASQSTSTAPQKTTEAPLTTWESEGTKMFTDTITAMEGYTITFKEHGKFRYEANTINDQLKTFKVGDEILIGFKWLSLYSKDTPRIDKVFMLSKTKLDLGDPNGDSTVDAMDATLVLAEYANIATGGAQRFSDFQRTASDVNKDGSVDAADVSAILGMYAYNSTTSAPFETMEEYLGYTAEKSYREKLLSDTDCVFEGYVQGIVNHNVNITDDETGKVITQQKGELSVAVTDVYYGDVHYNTDAKKEYIRLLVDPDRSLNEKADFNIELHKKYIFAVQDVTDADEERNGVKLKDSTDYILRCSAVPADDEYAEEFKDIFKDK